jgi:hypothetical protein
MQILLPENLLRNARPWSLPGLTRGLEKIKMPNRAPMGTGED